MNYAPKLGSQVVSELHKLSFVFFFPTKGLILLLKMCTEDSDLLISNLVSIA